VRPFDPLDGDQRSLHDDVDGECKLRYAIWDGHNIVHVLQQLQIESNALLDAWR
jgi:hypothetical protein